MSLDTNFFNEHKHIKIPLKLMGTKYDALEKLYSIKAKYGIPPELLHRKRTEEQKELTFENCLSAIFNHLPLRYLDGKTEVKPTIKQVYYLTQTLWDLVPSTRPSPPRTRPAAAASRESKGAAGRGGRRRRKTKKRKKRKRKTRKKKTRKRNKKKN